jgi:hypothetical protein
METKSSMSLGPPLKVLDELTEANGWTLHESGWIGPSPETEEQRQGIKTLVERFWVEVSTSGDNTEYPSNCMSLHYLTEYVFVDDDANDDLV